MDEGFYPFGLSLIFLVSSNDEPPLDIPLQYERN